MIGHERFGVSFSGLNLAFFISFALFFASSFLLICVQSVFAEDTFPVADIEEPQTLPAEPQMLGKLEGNGTHFEIKNSKYMNITLDSSEPVDVILESIPEMVTMQFESVSGAASTEITLSNFQPLTTYHKYEDDYHNHIAFTTDESGNYTYIQDISLPHIIFIQPRPSTKFVNDNSTGGDCTSIGNWDSATKTCTLTMDLTETIQIDRNGITLDGNRHTITGSNTGNGVFISGRTGVTIKNLNVRRFTYGIRLDSSSNNSLTNNNASLNSYGIYLYYSSNNNNLTSNNATLNSYGIFLHSSSNNSLARNTMQGNVYNLYINGNDDLHFNNNNIDTSNTVDGKPIYYVKNAVNEIYDSSTNAGTFYCINCNNITIKGLTLTKNGVGLFLWKTHNSRIENILASDNNYGINLYSSSNNNITSNNATSNSYGIYLRDSSKNNSLTSNNATSNSIGIYLGYSCNNNNLINNNANLNGYGIYITVSSNNNLSSNNATSNRYGIYLSSSSNNIITNNTANFNNYGYGIALYSSSNNNLSDNTANSNSNYGIALYSSSNNKLTSNTMSSNTYNFRLDGSYDADFNNNIDTSNTVDGKPIYYVKNAVNEIYDSPTNAGTFYCISCNNVTIQDLTLTNNGVGVYLSQTQNSRINNISATNNSYGIMLYSSSNNNLTGNTATSNLNFGIYVSSSSNNNLTSNTATSSYVGIGLYSSGNNNLASNNAILNSNGIGLYSSGNNSLTNNNATSSNNIGIYLSSSSNNNLTSNVATSNGYGIYLGYSSNNNLTSNTATLNYVGIYLSSSNNNLTGNTATSNSNIGIYLLSASNNNLTSNNATLNANYGILLESSSNNKLASNTMSGNMYNFYLVGSSDATFNNNIDRSNSVDGKPIYYIRNAVNQVYGVSMNAGTFYCISCNNVTIQDLTLTKNGAGVYLWQTQSSRINNISASNNRYGIYIQSSNNNNLTSNTASSNGDGIYLQTSNGNNLTSNTANLNSNGIYIYSSSNNNITNNNATLNSNGIYIYSSSNNNIINNNATLNSNGIYIYSSSNNNIINNNATLNSNGIYIYSSSNNNITSNTMSGNKYNFYLLGSSDAAFDNNIDTSNTVDGKSIYYVKNAVNEIYDGSSNAGTFYCINCNNVTIKGLALIKNGAGLFLWKTHNSRIENILASNNMYGIYLHGSSNNSLASNNASLSGNHGIVLYYSSNNSIVNNTASDNGRFGIILSGSSNNIVYNNNFINNQNSFDLWMKLMKQAYVSGGSANIFNLSAPTGGNYWSDYDTPSEGCNNLNNDSFCDEPYIFLFHSGQDDLPWIHQDAWNQISPTAKANGPYVGDEGSEIALNASGSYDPDGIIALYEWDLNGDGVYDINSTSPITTVTWDDDYAGSIGLRVTDDGGLTDTDSTSVTVNNVPPTASAINNGPVDEGTPVNVTASQIDPGVDSFSYSFDWNNDGSYEIIDQAGSSASYTFMDNGTYVVRVQVKDDDGGTGIATTEVTIRDMAPNAEFTWNPKPRDEGSQVLFADESTSYPDIIVSWDWDFGDGETSIEQNPAHIYGDDGQFTVSLTITDDDGSANTISYDVTIVNLDPTAAIDSVEQPVPGFILPNHELTFNGNFADQGWLDIHTSLWDFGDGSTGSGTLLEENMQPDATGISTITHSYSTPGVYTVTLTITDDDAGVKTATTNLEVVTPQKTVNLLRDIILALPEDAWSGPAEQRKNAFINKLDEVINKIDLGDYQEAINKLQNDVRSKADGSVGGNSKNDWITDPEAQQEITAMIDAIIAYLQMFI